MLINNQIINKFIQNCIFLIIVLTILFGRTFMGLYIFNYRLGELIVAFGLALSLYFLFYNKKLRQIYDKKFFISTSLIFISSFISIFVSSTLKLNAYNFKSSSFIWLMGYMFIAHVFKKYIYFEKYHLIVLNITLLLIYLFSVIYFPSFLKNFFTVNSDKFDFLKASDILIALIIIIILNNSNLIFKFKYSTEYFFMLISIFLPLLVFKSRGSAIAFIVFIVLELFRLKKSINYSIFKWLTLIIFSLVMFFSSAFLVTDSVTEYDQLSLNVNIIDELLEEKNSRINSFMSFYIIDEIDDLINFKLLDNGRIFSTDGNINFRLQIWQDVLLMSFEKNRYIYGIGYNEIIPAMNNPLYGGQDGTNEYVHNFIVNIYARGGLILVFLYYLFYAYLYKLRKEKDYLFVFIIPLLVVSIFDSSMSSVQFPMLFFFYIGYFLININKETYQQKRV